MFGWAMITSRVSSQGSGFRNEDTTGGATNKAMVPHRAADFAFRLNVIQRPLARDSRMPNTLRFAAQTRSEPPSVPVYSYHWIHPVVRAKALPSTSQGQLICALVRYHRSQAIQAKARNM